MKIDKPRWKQVKDVADDLTQDFTAPPIHVLEIAEYSGVEVIFADFGEHTDTVAGFCHLAKRKIYVNRHDRPIQQIFTMAHELGHWLLHRDIFGTDTEKYPVLARFQLPDNDDPLEQEANHFAANLLVPERLLRPVKHAPIDDLVDIFKVSVMMMNRRLRNIRG